MKKKKLEITQKQEFQKFYKKYLNKTSDKMICIKTDMSQEICDIDDELKAIYHSRDTVCIWVFKTREDRNRFMDETSGMKKEEIL